MIILNRLLVMLGKHCWHIWNIFACKLIIHNSNMDSCMESVIWSMLNNVGIVLGRLSKECINMIQQRTLFKYEYKSYCAHYCVFRPSLDE